MIRLSDLISNIFEQYGQSDEVKDVQEALNKFFDKEEIEQQIPVDGFQSKQLEDGLALFQQYHGIIEPQVCGHKTLTSLSNLGYLSKSKLESVLAHYKL
jgi:hypothetical protein